jgi:hypothetical protein
MSELQPIIPAQQDDGILASPQDTPEPAPITEQEVGEYREQDRFLPVRDTVRVLALTPRLLIALGLLLDCQCLTNNEGGCASFS